jgi:hypothetical protein
MTNPKFYILCACIPILSAAYVIGERQQREDERMRPAIDQAIKAKEMARIETETAERTARNRRCGMNAAGGIVDSDAFISCNMAAARAAGSPDYEAAVMRDQLLRSEYRRRFGD